MTQKNKERTYRALTTASSFIQTFLETGCDPEGCGEESEEGLEEYGKACERAAKLILTLAKKYKPNCS